MLPLFFIKLSGKLINNMIKFEYKKWRHKSVFKETEESKMDEQYNWNLQDIFENEEQFKYEWARIPHFYSDFYVYKYCTGVSSAIAIASKILNKEPGFVERYIEMLKQGCSKKSIDLLEMVDVDLESKDTYKSAIEFYNQKIEELKELL